MAIVSLLILFFYDSSCSRRWADTEQMGLLDAFNVLKKYVDRLMNTKLSISCQVVCLQHIPDGSTYLGVIVNIKLCDTVLLSQEESALIVHLQLISDVYGRIELM